MICISINQESRRLALFDMYNAARQGDLLEVRIDRFGKAPDLGEILATKTKPVIMCCRRAQDGGFWEGTENERLAILRQCIVGKADYVEIELDVADQVRRFPPSQRVISYTNLRETPSDILEIYDEARSKSPDVIKLVTLARTPEEAWPLVQILAKATVPTVVVGLGKPGIMLSLLGKKIGAPWTYAALERGMEAYPGQATVHDLKTVYHVDSINKATRFIGVTGFGEREVLTVAALNAALAHHELHFRCLPMGVGNVKLFRKVMEAVKLGAAVIDSEHQTAMMEIGAELHGAARLTQAIDLLVNKNDTWHGFHTACQAWIAGLNETMGKPGADNPLKNRMVVIVGLNPMARILAAEVQRQGGNAVLASHERKAGQHLAHTLGCRFVLFEALYSTMHDVLIVCDEEKEEGPGRTGGSGIHAGYLKSGITVMDLTAGVGMSPLLKEAKGRDCPIVDPRRLFLWQLEQQAALLTGKPVPPEILAAALPESAAESE